MAFLLCYLNNNTKTPARGVFLLLFFLGSLNPEHLGAIVYYRRTVRHEYECLANLALGQPLEHLLLGGLVKGLCHLVKDKYASRT